MHVFSGSNVVSDSLTN